MFRRWSKREKPATDDARPPARELPTLYPDLSPMQLCRFMDDATFERIRKFPLVTILPFVSANSQRRDATFGIGLSRLLIRDLMLVDGISVRGPEDTPAVNLELVRDHVAQWSPGFYVSGQTFVEKDEACVDLSVLRTGHETRELHVRQTRLAPLVSACAESIAATIGVPVSEQTRVRWQYGRPSSGNSLCRLGQIIAEYGREDSRQGVAALKLWQDDPNLVIATHLLDTEYPDIRATYLDSLERDPYDAQLCFLLFLHAWHSSGYEPQALQFARRAVELSPGHGKAHMCLPHAAHPDVSLIRHSELGYKLLPGNSFAINNLILYLAQEDNANERLLQLAEEGIEADPFNPTNYDRMIEVLTDAGDYQSALEVALRLQELFEPSIHLRARYCLEQNPERARLLQLGHLDPAAENRRLISELRSAIASGRM